MSEQSLAHITPNPVRRAPHKFAPRVKGKLKVAIDLIVFDGRELQQAAAESGLTTYDLRQAFAKPHVIQYLKQRRDVFRAAVNGKNIYRLAQIRDAADNMPAVNAIKELEAIDQTAIAQSGNKQTAGVVIQIVTGERNMTATHQINASECNAMPNDNQISNPLVSTNADPPSSNSADEPGVGEN